MLKKKPKKYNLKTVGYTYTKELLSIKYGSTQRVIMLAFSKEKYI